MNFTKIKLRNPPRSDVVVFDVVSKEFVEKYILKGISHTNIPTRHEWYYVGFKVLVYFLLNILLERKFHKSHLYRIYLKSLIQAANPKIVLTYIDNNTNFHLLSREMRRVKFVAIQNGVRDAMTLTPKDQGGMLPNKVEFGRSISMPLLFSHGPFDQEFYRKFGHQVDEFIPVGSLLGGYYLTEVRQDPLSIIYDLCLISQWRAVDPAADPFPEASIGVDVLCELLAWILNTERYTLAIALRSDLDREKNYYRKYFADFLKSGQVVFVEHDRSKFSSYATIDQSQLTIAIDSTLSRETLGMKKKILFCNTTGHPNYTFPVPGFYSCVDPTEEEFRNKVNELIAMPLEIYLDRTKALRESMMTYNLNAPAHRVIRRKLLEWLHS